MILHYQFVNLNAPSVYYTQGYEIWGFHNINVEDSVHLDFYAE